jgi:hypothetical protein
MQFRHDRRRRVFADDSGTAAALTEDSRAAAENSAREAKAEAYTPAARREQQPHLTDLVPRRYLTLSFWLLAGLIIIGALEGLYVWMPSIASVFGAETLVPLDLAERSSVAGWFSTLLLGTGALVALLIFSLRRHRIDDYHGRYRVWLWVALGLVALSLDEATGLHTLVRSLITLAAGSGSSSEAWLWGGGCAAVLGLAGLRLAVEVRHCHLAASSLLLAAMSFTLAIAVHLGGIVGLEASGAVMLKAGARMVGQLLVWWSVVAYARHVVLDADGLLPVVLRKARPKKPKKVKPPADEKASSSSAMVDPPQKPKPHTAPRTDLDPVHKTVTSSTRTATAEPTKKELPARPALAVKAAVSRDDDDGDEDTSDQRGLTRAERKRLRREAKK